MIIADMTTDNITQILLFIIFLIIFWILVQIDQHDSTIDINSTEHMSGDCNCSNNSDIDSYNDQLVYTPYHNCMVEPDSNISNKSEEFNEELQHVHSMYNDYDKLLCCDTEFCENYTIIRKSDDYSDFPVDPYLNY